VPALGKLNPVPKTVCGFVEEGEGGLVRKAHLDNFRQTAGVKQAKCVREAWRAGFARDTQNLTAELFNRVDLLPIEIAEVRLPPPPGAISSEWTFRHQITNDTISLVRKQNMLAFRVVPKGTPLETSPASRERTVGIPESTISDQQGPKAPALGSGSPVEGPGPLLALRLESRTRSPQFVSPWVLPETGPKQYITPVALRCVYGCFQLVYTSLTQFEDRETDALDFLLGVLIKH
jgi:hypothetical protein